MKKYLRVHSQLRFTRHELLREFFSRCDREKWIHNPLFDLSVQANVDQIVSVNVPAYLANSSCNSSRLISRRCEWTFTICKILAAPYITKMFQNICALE